MGCLATTSATALGVFKLDFDFSNIGSQKGSRRISHDDEKTTFEDIYVGRKNVKILLAHFLFLKPASNLGGYRFPFGRND